VFPHVHLVDQNRQIQKDYAFYNNSRNLVYLPEQGIYRARTGNRYHLYFYFTRIPAVEIRILNGEEAGLSLRNKTRQIFDSVSEDRQNVLLDFSDLAPVKINRRKVIPLEIHAFSCDDHESFLFFRISTDR
jgi:hypothetical protein